MRKMFPVELNPVVLARSSLCDLDRYLILMLSGGFKVGPHGELLFFPWWPKRGYVVPSARQWLILQAGSAIAGLPLLALGALIGLGLLAVGVDFEVAAPLFTVIPIVLSILWVSGVSVWCALRLQRSPEIVTNEESRAIKRAVRHPSLILTFATFVLVIVTFGISGVAMARSATSPALVFLFTAVMELAYLLHRLLRPLPPRPVSSADT
jgi:hypothetical protein